MLFKKGILSLLACTAGASGAHIRNRDTTSVFLLAGDSTTAKQTNGGGGWGEGFKNFTINSPSFAVNYGHNGATTSSFISGGDWETVLSAASQHSASKTVYVTIQFGHNDQKLSDFVETYKSNLRRMISDVESRNAIPIIVTSISRRKYGSNGTIKDTLADWAGYAISIANEGGTMYIDLWKNSVEYLEKIGETAARKLDLKSGDATHLNGNGSIVFGRMVMDLLCEKSAAIKAVAKQNEKMSGDIQAGRPIF
ncbi:Carbohydrate Esterase Family 12 protein [Tuber magnatum]|uniref:Carbohydrate Esterase Family 12 protein n=1 Tax=Tuber magnatum TaxID=42249 RepID=A0A317T0Y3_9PEZI|nr:Carbohydrate Esterase Family 12 protein [Tuber magnatum]